MVEMETEVDKDDKVLTGFAVNLMSCFPWPDQQRWIKKQRRAKRGKVLLSRTESDHTHQHWKPKNIMMRGVRLKVQEYTHPNLHVIWALVILLVEDLEVVLSGWDQAEDGNRELWNIGPSGEGKHCCSNTQVDILPANNPKKSSSIPSDCG